MQITLLFLFAFMFKNDGDTLLLPIKDGKIIQNKPGVDKLNKALLISLRDDNHVRSCLDGKIATIKKDEWGYVVGIKSDSVVIIYSIFDSVDVALGDWVKQGDIIGRKSLPFVNENYIMFSVFIRGREAEATDYLVRQ